MSAMHRTFSHINDRAGLARFISLQNRRVPGLSRPLSARRHCAGHEWGHIWVVSGVTFASFGLRSGHVQVTFGVASGHRDDGGSMTVGGARPTGTRLGAGTKTPPALRRAHHTTAAATGNFHLRRRRQ